MGLLDEAIREHLELKRRRGADPGDIARAEHEALEPIFPDEPAEPGDGSQLARVGQETAELDMQAVLDADDEHSVGGTASADEAKAAPGELPEQDPLAWELPERRDGESVPENIPGQERLEFE